MVLLIMRKNLILFTLTSLSVNNLVANIVSQEGNRAKIKLRAFFYRNNKNLWK